MLVAQQSLVDPTRAPQGHHTLWAYCHVPNGSDVDMTDAIERQIERFAPGFGELVLARSARGPAEVEADNPNYIGGDINGGLAESAPGARPSGAAPLALHDAEPAALPVLVVHAAGWRCARDVRLSRRASRLEPIAAFAIVTVWNCINGTVYFIHQVSPFRAGHTEGDQVGFIREQTVQ